MGELADLQDEIRTERARRGFTTDPSRLLTLLVEELGEVAAEVKRTWSANYDEFDPDRLAPELADVLVLLCALASEFGIDLDDAVRDKFFRTDAQRRWRTAHPSSST